MDVFFPPAAPGGGWYYSVPRLPSRALIDLEQLYLGYYILDDHIYSLVKDRIY